MPALKELKTRRGLLAGASALLASCGLDSEEKKPASGPAPIAAPRPGSSPNQQAAPAPARVEASPTLERKGFLWQNKIPDTVSNSKNFPIQESNPDKITLQQAYLLTDGSNLYANNETGVIIQMDSKTGSEIWSSKERGFLLGTSDESVFFLRQDNRVYKINKATKKIDLVAEAPREAFSQGNDAYYRYPARFGSGFLAIPYAGYPVSGHHVYSFDGAYNQRIPEVLVDVSGPSIFTFISGNGVRNDIFRLRQPGKPDPLIEGINGRLYANKTSEIFATASRISPAIFTTEFLLSAGNTNNGRILHSYKETNADYNDQVLPVLVNRLAAIFETRRNQHFWYTGLWLEDHTTSYFPSEPYPSEFFELNGTIYYSTPARNYIGVLHDPNRSNNNYWENNDAKAMDIVGKTQVGEKQVLLVQNWKSGGPRFNLYPSARNDIHRVTALNNSTGEKFWTFDAPKDIEWSTGDSDYFPAQTTLVGNKLVVAGRIAFVVDVTSGKSQQVEGYKSPGARLIKSIGDLVFIQSRSDISAIRV